MPRPSERKATTISGSTGLSKETREYEAEILGMGRSKQNSDVPVNIFGKS